jgi:DHA2 family multidrug resistance protein
MGYATSLFNLMRNIGGGIGIAITGTMLARQRQAFAATMGERLTIYDPATQTMLSQLKAGFVAAGADAFTATNRAYYALSGMLQRQAAMVSFITIFRGLGFLFLILIPLVLLMRRPRTGAVVDAGH